MNNQPTPQYPNGFMVTTQPSVNGQGNVQPVLGQPTSQPLALGHQPLTSPNFGVQFMHQQATIHQGVGPQAFPYNQSGVNGTQPATQPYLYNQSGVNGGQSATLAYHHNTSGVNGSHPTPLSVINFPQGQPPQQLVQFAQQAPIIGGFVSQVPTQPQPMRPTRPQNRSAHPVQKISAPVKKPIQLAPSLTDRQLSAIHRSVLELVQIARVQQHQTEKMIAVMTANKISEDLVGPKRRGHRHNRFEGKEPGGPWGRKGFSGRAKTVPPIGIVSVPVLAAPVQVLEEGRDHGTGSDPAAPSTSNAADSSPFAEEEVVVDDSIAEEDQSEKSLQAP